MEVSSELCDLAEFLVWIVYVTARALYAVVQAAGLLARVVVALADFHLILEPLSWTGRIAAPALTFGYVRVNAEDKPFPPTGRFGLAWRDGGGLVVHEAYGLGLGIIVWTAIITAAALALSSAPADAHASSFAMISSEIS